MADNRNEKKDYLIQLFRGLPMTALEIEHEKTVELIEVCCFSESEAKNEILNQYREVLRRGGDIVDTIVRNGRYVAELHAVFVQSDSDIIVVDKSEVPDYDERYYNSYIDYISGQLCGYDFTVSNGKLLEDSKGWVGKIEEVFIAYEIVKHLTTEDSFVAETNVKITQPVKAPKGEKITIREIALLHIYLGTVITKENATDLVKPYGHTSGDKLYNEYTSFVKVSSRQRLPEQCTPRKYHNRVELFEKVIALLPEERKKAAQIDLKHIKCTKRIKLPLFAELN